MTQVIHGLTRDELVKRVYGSPVTAEVWRELEASLRTPSVQIPEHLKTAKEIDQWLMGGFSDSNQKRGDRK